MFTLNLPTSNVSTSSRDTSSTGKPRKLLTHLSGNDFVLELDWTSFQSFLACPSKAKWQLLHSRVEGRSPALLYGNAIHHALEAHYRNPALPLESKLTRGRAEFAGKDPVYLDWRTEDKYARTIEEYIKKYHEGDSELFSLLQLPDGTPVIEQAFTIPFTTFDLDTYVDYPIDQIVAPFNHNDCPIDPETNRFWIDSIHVMWTGVIDLAFTAHGQNWIMDHKTSSIGGNSFWEQFTLSHQLRGYIWAAQYLTQQTFKGGVVNALFGRKPTEKGKGKELELERKWIHYRPDQITKWHSGMLSHLSNFVTHFINNDWPENSISCTTKYGTCPYLGVCELPESNQLTLLNSDLFATNEWSPFN